VWTGKFPITPHIDKNFGFAKSDAVFYNAKWQNMDISEALSVFKFLLPVAASWIVFHLAKRIQSGWLRHQKPVIYRSGDDFRYFRQRGIEVYLC
jgi:hypothetical protein